MLTQLHNLRTLNLRHLFTVDGSASEGSAVLIRVLNSNLEIKDFQCVGRLAENVVQKLTTLPLRRLDLLDGAIDDDKFAKLANGPCASLKAKIREPKSQTNAFAMTQKAQWPF